MRLPALALAVLLAAPVVGAQTESLKTKGLKAPVTLARDTAGIVHITAQNEHDLFFAQGWSVARDRLWQLETWRRRATGTVSEWIGARGLAMDEASRMFRYRGDIRKEMLTYHPHGPEIIQAFVDGINAFVALTEKEPDRLPPEFAMLGTKPGKWTPAVVVSRHNGLFLGGAPGEVEMARVVGAIGAERARPLYDLGPADPRLSGDPRVDYAALPYAALTAPISALRGALIFEAGDLAAKKRADAAAEAWRVAVNAEATREATARLGLGDQMEGSNNWVVAASRTATGKPLLANDPHRVIASPSLRYYVHLKAPGWNVIGGGEPSLPGVAIGHNEAGAWGLTIFAIDGEDLLEYETDPANPDRYRYKDGWEAMKVVAETLKVKDAEPVIRRLRFTRHGPVVAADPARHKAWAYRTTMLEPGTSPYLGSLRMDQARSWAEFKQACAQTFAPPENMVWVDTAGTIGWQVVGKAPVRTTYSGLLPVRGDGTHEWQGFLPVLELPGESNPAKGFLHSANEMNVPRGYGHLDAVGHDWADELRAGRIAEVLTKARGWTVDSMRTLQYDATAVAARTLVPLVRAIGAPALAAARDSLLAWDQRMEARSVGAGIYGAYERAFRARLTERLVPAPARAGLRALELAVAIRWAEAAGRDSVAARDSLATGALADAVAALRARQGSDISGWTWGGARGHRAELVPAFTALRDSSQRRALVAGPMPVSGYSYAVLATGYGELVDAGPSFRLVADPADWERSVGTNTPGQSADPRSKYYKNLFEGWATGRYFPLPFSAARVKAATREVTELKPSRR